MIMHIDNIDDLTLMYQLLINFLQNEIVHPE